MKYIPFNFLMTILCSGAQLLLTANDQTFILEQKIDSIMQAEEVPGCQTAIFTADSLVWNGSFGLANIEKEQAVSDENLFRVGSITKTFVAIAVMQLAEQGKLSLSDRIRDVVPEVTFVNEWEETDPVRVIHLLEHTTGWDDYSLKEYATSGEKLTLLEGIEFSPGSRTSRWRPGTWMQYCNSGPSVAAYIVEKLTGLVFEDYLRKHILKPVGMPTASMELDDRTSELLVSNYDNGKEQFYWHILMRPAGSLNSTAIELSRFVRMLMNYGSIDSLQLVGKKYLQRMEQVGTTYFAKAGNTRGYGPGLYVMNVAGHYYFTHSGGMAGALALYGYNRELDIGFVTMINASNMPALVEIGKALIGFFEIEEKQMGGEEAVFDDDYLGTYRVANTRMQYFYPIEKLANFFSIFKEDGTYYLKPLFDEKRKLTVGGENILFSRNERGLYAEYTFTEDMNGRSVMGQLMGGWGNYIKKDSFEVWSILIWTLCCLALMLSTIVYGLIWPLVHLIRRIRKRSNKNLCLKLPHLFSTLFLLASSLMFGMLPVDKLFLWMGHFTIYSLIVYVFGILFFLFAFLALYRSLSLLAKPGPKVLKIYSLLVSVALVNAAIYLAYWGMIFTPSWV